MSTSSRRADPGRGHPQGTSTRPTVLLWSPFKAQVAGLVAALREEDADLCIATSEAEAVRLLPEADALWATGVHHGYGDLLAAAVHAAPRLRWLQLLSTGQEALEQHGVPSQVAVTTVGNSSAAVVAEHAVALLLALTRRLGDAAVQGSRGEWNRSIAARMGSLEGQTLCLAGFGRIGKEIAKRVQPFGMACIAVNRSGVNEAPDLVREVLPVARLHEALARSDAIAISLPLSEATRGLFDAAAWSACRRGALVVNVGRGAVVDGASLVAALQSGHLGAAGLDVTEPEPLPADDPLWRTPGVLITPHVGGAGSAAGLARLAALAADNLRRFRAGEPLQHVVTIGA